jgi:hypothetical protein
MGIGVLEKKKSGGPMGEEDQNGQALIPYRTARKIQTSEWLMLIIKAKSGEVKAALDQVEEVLRRQRRLCANVESNT